MENHRKTLDPQELVNDIAEWSDSTFGQSWKRIHGMADHLKEEAGEVAYATYELLHAYNEGPTLPTTQDLRNNLKRECSDVLMLTFDILRKIGVDFNESMHDVAEKLEINKGREWGTADGKSKVKHISEGPLGVNNQDNVVDITEEFLTEGLKPAKKRGVNPVRVFSAGFTPCKYIHNQIKNDVGNLNLNLMNVETLALRVLTNLIPFDKLGDAAGEEWIDLNVEKQKRSKQDHIDRNPKSFRIHARNQFTALLLDGWYIDAVELEEYNDKVLINQVVYHTNGDVEVNLD